jgi:hypothetical protein
MPRLEPPSFDFDRNGPFYDDGSVGIRFEYDAVPHHDPVMTDDFIVGIPEPGLLEVPWTFGAKNLPALATGLLRVEVEHEKPPLEPVTTLRELLELARGE